MPWILRLWCPAEYSLSKYQPDGFCRLYTVTPRKLGETGVSLTSLFVATASLSLCGLVLWGNALQGRNFPNSSLGTSKSTPTRAQTYQIRCWWRKKLHLNNKINKNRSWHYVRIIFTLRRMMMFSIIFQFSAKEKSTSCSYYEECLFIPCIIT